MLNLMLAPNGFWNCELYFFIYAINIESAIAMTAQISRNIIDGILPSFFRF